MYPLNSALLDFSSCRIDRLRHRLSLSCVDFYDLGPWLLPSSPTESHMSDVPRYRRTRQRLPVTAKKHTKPFVYIYFSFTQKLLSLSNSEILLNSVANLFLRQSQLHWDSYRGFRFFVIASSELFFHSDFSFPICWIVLWTDQSTVQKLTKQ